MQLVVPHEQFVFLDESGSNLAMARMKARSPRGQRAHCDRPVNRGKNMTMLGAVRASGPVSLRTFEGAVNVERFDDFIENTLLPNLKPGDILVMDNLRVHYSERAQDLLEDAGVQILYLPPYSPDLNPIENVWSVLKHYLRGRGARCVADLVSAINAIWEEQIARLNMMNIVKSCGYA